MCSPGEYDICRAAGIAAEKIVLSGVYKAEADVVRVIEECGERAVYTAESVSQMNLLERLAREKGVRLPVLLRLSCGNQFGMDEATVTSILTRKEGAYTQILGMQYYSGTQKKTEAVAREIGKLKAFAEQAAQAGTPLRRIEYGPGLRVNYFAGRRKRKTGWAYSASCWTPFPKNAKSCWRWGGFSRRSAGNIVRASWTPRARRGIGSASWTAGFII